MDLEIRHLGASPFREAPLARTIRRYGRGIARPILLDFVAQLGCSANHLYERGRGHVIRVNAPRHWWLDGTPKIHYGTRKQVAPLSRLSDGEARIHFLSSILHELRHAWQYENWGAAAYYHTRRHADLRCAIARYHYSPEEIDARAAEALVIQAAEFYNAVIDC